MDTSGFYKYENNELMHGVNFVESSLFLIVRENKDNYSYPVYGWYWFDSREEAEAFFIQE